MGFFGIGTGRLGGGAVARVRANGSTFTAGAPAGTIIAALIDPFAGRGLGATTFTTFGPVPGQLAISGGNLVAGSATAAAGNTYQIGVLATAGDASAAVGTRLAITATASTTPSPPTGYLFLTDPDGAYLTDTDGSYLMEAA